jgi:Ca-activated chloride channel homolog
MIALDVSNSMRAEDVPPSRLERAQFEIAGLLASLPGSRVGIVLFAGEAFLHSPLTTDLATVRRFVDAAEPELIPAQGTDLGEAIRVASRALAASPTGGEAAERRARVLLVVSDGEDHPDRYGAALREAEDAGIVIFAAGIGEPDGGPIPIYQDGRRTGFRTDRAGQRVTTRLDDETLRPVGRTGGYLHIGRAGGSLEDLAPRLAVMDRTVLASDRVARYTERFQWPLGLAIAMLALERMIAVRRPRRQFA